MLDFVRASCAPQIQKHKQQPLSSDALQNTTTSKSTGQHVQSLFLCVAREETLKAEVLWCLKQANSHWSFNSTQVKALISE